MKVWTKPELIVDTMELSQVYAAGCVLKSRERDSYTYRLGKNNQHINDIVLSFKEGSLQAAAAYEEPEDELTDAEVKQYAYAHGTPQNYGTFYAQDTYGKLYTS